MARSRGLSKLRTLRTEQGEEIDAPGYQLADEYLMDLEEVMSLEEPQVECPMCFRGAIVDSVCNRCQVAIPADSIVRHIAWRKS